MAPVRSLILNARPQEAVVQNGLTEIKADEHIGVALQRCGGGLDGKFYGTLQDLTSICCVIYDLEDDAYPQDANLTRAGEIYFHEDIFSDLFVWFISV